MVKILCHLCIRLGQLVGGLKESTAKVERLHSSGTERERAAAQECNKNQKWTQPDNTANCPPTMEYICDFSSLPSSSF